MASKEKPLAAKDEPTANDGKNGKDILNVVAEPMLDHYMENGIMAREGDTLFRVNNHYKAMTQSLDKAAHATGNKAFREDSQTLLTTRLKWANKQDSSVCPGRCS